MKAVTIKEFGGPEVMHYGEVDKPRPHHQQLLVKIEAAGLNYIDTYQRSGLYPLELPAKLGLEGAGVIVQLGLEITRFDRGQRVAFANAQGAYADYAVVDQSSAILIPEGISFEQAAASMLQGCTAHYLSRSTFVLNEDSYCLIHAGAGGVGLLLTQIARNMGAHVITTVSTREKAELSRAAGAHDVILYTEQDFEKEIRRITRGDGLDVVYDSVGLATFEKSLNCLKPRGMLVLYGNSSGAVTQFNPAMLAAKGSLYLTRPKLFDYIACATDLELRANEFFRWVRDGEVKLRIEHKFPLSEVQDAHRALEGRKTTGKVLLIP
ncbi:MAG: quinone oxidoreductase [Gammaproteobacteria bacterium]|nr:quinone oxidoreductase [Gammaproteobacteria bacterium]